ncbi:MAG: hypothetical protein M5U30_12065 [Burkholderiaceae bacterium]|nr:hypothetical protein [Burkholderiaceae bacterium]
MPIVDMAEQQRDRDCFRIERGDGLRDAHRRLLGQRGHHVASRVDPLRYLDDARSRHQRRRAALHQRVGIRAALAADLQYIPEAVGDCKRHPRTRTGQPCIRGDGEPVHKAVDRGRLDAGPGDQAADARTDCVRRTRRAEHLVGEALAGRAHRQDEIGERPADISGQGNHRVFPGGGRCRRCERKLTAISSTTHRTPIYNDRYAIL